MLFRSKTGSLVLVVECQHEIFNLHRTGSKFPPDQSAEGVCNLVAPEEGTLLAATVLVPDLEELLDKSGGELAGCMMS